MKATAAILLTLFSVTLAAGKPPDPAPPAPAAAGETLRWRNGETLAGEMVGASAGQVTWKSLLFEDPLLLDWRALDRIDQPAAAIAPVDSFAFTLRDGSYLCGEPAAITDGTVAIRSSRHGDVVLDRSELLSMRRIRGSGLIFAGPSGDAGWKEAAPAGRQGGNNFRATSNSAAAAVAPFTEGPGGALVLPYWNRGAILPLALPDRLEIEFAVHSTKFPHFRLSIDDASKQRLELATWGDELVLISGDDFKAIRKLAEAEREVALRVCWDRPGRHCAVFAPAGDLLAEWQVPDNKIHSPSGLTLQNEGRDLSLDLLRVRAWDGQPPPRLDTPQPRVVLADGRVLPGQVSRGSAQSVAMPAGKPDLLEQVTGIAPAFTEFSLANVDEIVFSTANPDFGHGKPALFYADGTMLLGRLCGVEQTSVELETSFTGPPLASLLQGVRRIVNQAPPRAGAAAEPPLADWDKIVLGTTTLHGHYVSAGDDRPHWLPVGGLQPAAPAKGLSCEITRAFAPDARFPDTPALFYTREGDALPGRLRAIDSSGVEFESSVVEVTKLPAASLAAVQFLEAGARVNLHSFSDPGWRILKGDDATVQRTGGTLKMEPGTAIMEPAAMQCREIQFAFDETNWSVLRLKMFCDGADATHSSNLLLMQMGGQFSWGLEAQEGQFGGQQQIRTSDPVTVRLVIDDKQVDLYLDGVLSETFSIGPESRAGNGLIIEPASVWGNQVNAIALSAFSASSPPGRIHVAPVNAQAKIQVLTVPRFRKDDPPKNVLLAANGDVLRGDIEAATAAVFSFRSGLETLSVPRERVEAAIWLQKPDGAQPAPEEKSGVRKLLDRKIEQRVRFSSIGLTSLIYYLRQQVPELKIQLPDKQDGRQYPLQFGGETIAALLDRVCALYGLSYRIDGKGTVIFESGVQPANNLVRHLYWLRPEAFPKTGSAQEILTAKGIAFPEGAAANWQREAAQLTVINTAENQAKLAQLLETDFGGSVGSPNYWLRLASGAELGLVVDAFDQDCIRGHHPVYGRCTVPVSEVCVIRNSPPEPTVAMKSLEDWRLAFAPEPVLPEAAGGESSPMVGKAAPTFKIPLLEGGDFDLAQQKGKVIVLDFWATWCGPCVQSLPGLMQSMAAFPADQVKLIGVDQSEPNEQVKSFLRVRGWKLTVAMDAGQNVGRQYGVDGIPHTVVIGPDGKVAWEKTGYSPDGEAEAADAVKRLLAPVPPADRPKNEPKMADVR